MAANEENKIFLKIFFFKWIYIKKQNSMCLSQPEDTNTHVQIINGERS